MTGKSVWRNYRKIFSRTSRFPRFILGVFLLLFCLVCAFAEDSVTQYRLPFKDNDAGYFFEHDGTLYLGNHPERTIYRVTGNNRCEKVEDVQGWYTVDACLFDGRIIYCSRERILYRDGKKVKAVTMKGSERFYSVTTDGKILYLLDARKTGFYIMTVDKSYKITGEFSCPLRNPWDITFHDGFLWIYDQRDKCVHRMSLKSHKLTARIYAETGHSWSQGIVFLGNTLYIHDRAESRLVPVVWKEEGNAVYSEPAVIKYRFIQKSENKDAKEDCRAEFRVPVPADAAGAVFKSIVFDPEPDTYETDGFGQQLAYYEKVTIPPKGKHILSCTVDVAVQTMEYNLDDVPLKGLDVIPETIRKLYLKGDSYITTDDPGMIKAAREARLDAQGREPAGVRSLIENIAGYVMTRMEYAMDDDWDSAPDVLNKKTGSCSEYSFVFSTLARLNRVPTRLAGGFERSGSLHRWTEVYFPGTGWVPVDVTKMDADDPESYDYEFLFGKPGGQVAFSRIGNPDDTPLGVNYYIYRRFMGGKRERSAELEILSYKPAYEVTEVAIQAP
ncbi:MAG: transglutaminase domain-containing protein [Spirochaetales bacterium]|nr:transglutaminase domain-containing protein [Spirochaetales bacterium]